jgi:hypothetical protein
MFGNEQIPASQMMEVCEPEEVYSATPYFPPPGSGWSYMGDMYEPMHAPCQGSQPWDYGYCFGGYGAEPCQYTNVVDIEDFM